MSVRAQPAPGTAFAAGGPTLSVHDSTGTIQATTAVLTSLGYSGEFFDAAAQQQYLRARFYNPANGRFNRLDPFAGNLQDPQSLHKYAYVHGDPIQGVDPTGLFLGGGGLGIGLGFSSLTSLTTIQDGLASLYFEKSAIDAIYLSQLVRLDFADYFSTVTRSLSLINVGGVHLEIAFGMIVDAYRFSNGDFFLEEDVLSEEVIAGGRRRGFGGRSGWWSRNKHLYRKRMVDGKHVYVSKSKFNPEARAKDVIDADQLSEIRDRSERKYQKILNGATNKELMREGFTPIGRDGKEMNLHHSTFRLQQGREPNTIYELPGSVHTKYDGELHKILKRYSSSVDRNAFDSYRAAYWKWRAENPGHG